MDLHVLKLMYIVAFSGQMYIPVLRTLAAMSFLAFWETENSFDFVLFKASVLKLRKAFSNYSCIESGFAVPKERQTSLSLYICDLAELVWLS